jgi:predicted nucleic acid-binding protein
MPGFLLDSDVLIDFLRGRDQAHAFLLGLPGDSAISAVSVAELYAGVREGAERVKLRKTCDLFDIIPVDSDIAEMGGLLRRDWGKSHGVGLNDALIAATARLSDMALCTLNVKHYPMLRKSELKQAYVKP